MVQLNTPPMLRGGGQAQLAQMRSYLYRLAEQLNGALNAIEADSLTEGAKATLGSGAAESAAQQVREDMGKTSSVLKDLIIKTAESVRSETQRVETELRSSYVAKSEFGAYQEQVDAKFTATAEDVTQSIRYVSELEGRLDEQAGDLQGLISYRTETKGYIRQGIVGYEDTVPIIGIAIGQDIQTTGTQSVDGKTYDVIDTSHNMSVWTSKKLSFYVEGTEIAYFSNGALHVGHVELDRITAAGKWDVSFSDGVELVFARAEEVARQPDSECGERDMHGLHQDMERRQSHAADRRGAERELYAHRPGGCKAGGFRRLGGGCGRQQRRQGIGAFHICKRVFAGAGDVCGGENRLSVRGEHPVVQDHLRRRECGCVPL